MRSVGIIYQYLKEYSKETVEQFDDLMDQVMDQAEQGNIFSEEDIDDLCNLLFTVERDLEDESSYNIDWTIKDRIMETIIILIWNSGQPTCFEIIAKAIGKYSTLSRPYLKYVIETFLTVFLLGVPNQSEDEIIRNRTIFLGAMKEHTRKEIVKKFCESNLKQIKDKEKNEELPPKTQELKSSLFAIYKFACE
ncbi:MAG: hypothetical protein E7A95_02800 [Hungatella hathewayi]|jgi:hypothetical protein|nr:hypothetical protein [Hungatella hathewayi]